MYKDISIKYDISNNNFKNVEINELTCCKFDVMYKHSDIVICGKIEDDNKQTEIDQWMMKVLLIILK